MLIVNNTLFNLTTLELHDMLTYRIEKDRANSRKSEEQYLVFQENLLDSYDNSESI